MHEIEFLDADEKKWEKQFIEQGYIIHPVESPELLDKIAHFVANVAAEELQVSPPKAVGEFLNCIAQYVDATNLNQLRIKIIDALLAQAWFRPAYFRLVKKMLSCIVGNELVMQRGIGLSIQLPNDTSSLLNIHADSWSGDSPYEAVVWVPLVDCYRTKSMFLLPPQKSREVYANFSDYQAMNNDEFFHAIEKDLIFIDIPYGNFLLFNHNLPHGNRINEESDTRWSLNCRFKSVFSPYADKKLGEFFEPITLRPATRIGMTYQYPKIKELV